MQQEKSIEILYTWAKNPSKYSCNDAFFGWDFLTKPVVSTWPFLKITWDHKQTMKQQMNIDHSCSGAKFDTTKQLPVFNWCYIMCLFLFLTYFHENNFDLILFPIYEWRDKHQNQHHDSKRPESSAIHQITKVGTPNGCSPGAKRKSQQPIVVGILCTVYNLGW